ncbi:Oxidoreductase, short-chain dehydrogenase/reductase family [Penicillium digitatum]|uniref:Oxidoreductase, short-chain dehydrogenase/reductase family n=3 Tax=Penicillium digitatum TaxID=36651 RepID=K9FWT7_PEND2|nr:Oxidoreductase, short-chain dehydrogenase/reductase family [Penicillium digitatum Pd1]EKV04595.1 Oxidoreductase, short-chain dehydrogenase/reductase family [Penicillium digitatum Pd1]EKV05506.1 Oxidoreductase, short-chain dehydrogenase/reductase family [Penicillium digitatum PHI26]QQK45607.1 Oxidoreductase, short-chain dehydrogenase/reductase family [Penicillium digitatum]
MPTITYNPDSMPDLSGKVILITGGTGGLGAESALRLAQKSPAHIYISGRKAANADKVIQQIRKAGSKTPVTFLPCDLASLVSVKQAAESFLALESRLDILMCNAGIMATPPGLTADGYEIQFGTNHLGHALLIRKLLPLLETSAEAADVRIILLTSLGFKMHPSGGIVFDAVRTKQEFSAFGGWIRYGQSKLANLLYARELARRYPAMTSVSVTPGVVNTGLVENLGRFNRAFVWITNLGQLLKPEEGAYNQLWASTVAKATLQNGQFYEPVGVLSTKLDKASQDAALAKRLWEWTEEALQAYL